jgi:fibronectin type 3 domain-containing protein
VYSGSLQPVDDLVITLEGNHVLLSWSPAGGATGYRVYRGTDPDDPMGSDSIIGTTTGTSYLDSNVLLGTNKAFYVVTAVDD